MVNRRARFVPYFAVTAAVTLSMAAACGDPQPTPSPSDIATTAAPEPTYTSPELPGFTFTSSDGYSARVEFSPYELEKAKPTQMEVQGTRELSACDWNFETDGLIEFYLYVINITPGEFSMTAEIKYRLVGANVSGLSVETIFTSGPVCQSGDSLFGTRWPTMTPNRHNAIRAFVRVPKYITPNVPEGSADLVQDLKLQLVSIELEGETIAAGPEMVFDFFPDATA